MGKVEITSKDRDSDSANDAKVYIGNHLCGTFPSIVKRSKKYTFNCNVAGSYVKVVTGRNNSDKRLSFAIIDVYKLNKSNLIYN